MRDAFGAEVRCLFGEDRATNVTVQSLPPTGSVLELLSGNVGSLVCGARGRGAIGLGWGICSDPGGHCV